MRRTLEGSSSHTRLKGHLQLPLWAGAGRTPVSRRQAVWAGPPGVGGPRLPGRAAEVYAPTPPNTRPQSV